jgi:hypothetical protein
MRVMRWDCEPHHDKEAPGPPTRLLIAATAGSPVRGVPFAFVLLASAALWVLQCSPASAQPTLCTGDCNNNGFVTVNELLKGVNIALGTLRLSQCSGFDLNRDGTVTVDEILIAVNNALDGCPTGEVTFGKISLAVFPGGEETVSVTATDAGGDPVDWAVTSSAPSIVSAVKVGSQINVTGVSLGTAAIMVTTQTRLRRSVPVRVYDPMVLEVGDIQIKYVDAFECISPVSSSYAESFYRPVVPEGWYALGSFRMGEKSCPNVDGQQWMMAVRENPAIWATSFDESIDGDLPTSGEQPRALELAAGRNRVRGSLDGGADWLDKFSFTLKPGEHLNSVILNHFAGTSGTVRFFAGTDTAAPPPAFLGETFMSNDQIGFNYLDLLDLDLAPGVYSMAIVADAPQQYEFVLNIGEQPETLPLLTPSGGIFGGYSPTAPPYHGWQLWAPVCPQGYVGMGTVVTTDPGDGTWPPPTSEAATCVRKDLTVPGQLPMSGNDYFTARVETPDYTEAAAQDTTAYLDTGTMSVVRPTGYTNPYPVENVLAVKLPLLIDVAYQNWYPHLTGPERPTEYSEPVLVKSVLVPFTAIIGGSEYDTRGVGWMVENSPFVRVERVQRWGFWKDLPNSSTAQQSLHYSTTTGIDTNTSATYSGKAGVSVTAESGVEFLGIGGKVSATVSAEFGYSHQTSVTEFTQHTVTVDLNAAPCTYLCVWGLESSLVVKMLNENTGQLQNIADVAMSDYAESSATYAYDDYPIPECP